MLGGQARSDPNPVSEAAAGRKHAVWWDQFQFQSSPANTTDESHAPFSEALVHVLYTVKF